MSPIASRPAFICVDPAQIKVVPGFTVATQWDRAVIQSDLTEYVGISRTIPATPLVGIKETSLIGLNGAPFIIAAVNSSPALRNIICELAPGGSDITNLGYQPMSIQEVVKLRDSLEAGVTIDMFRFADGIDDRGASIILHRFHSLFSLRHDATVSAGRHGKLLEQQWLDRASVLLLKWTREFDDGGMQSEMYQCAAEVHASVARVRSWNGIRFDEFRPVQNR